MWASQRKVPLALWPSIVSAELIPKCSNNLCRISSLCYWQSRANIWLPVNRDEFCSICWCLHDRFPSRTFCCSLHFQGETSSFSCFWEGAYYIIHSKVHISPGYRLLTLVMCLQGNCKRNQPLLMNGEISGQRALADKECHIRILGSGCMSQPEDNKQHPAELQSKYMKHLSGQDLLL